MDQQEEAEDKPTGGPGGGRVQAAQQHHRAVFLFFFSLVKEKKYKKSIQKIKIHVQTSLLFQPGGRERETSGCQSALRSAGRAEITPTLK